MSIVIRLENVGKKYQLRHQNTAHYQTMRDVFTESLRGFGRRLLGGKRQSRITKEDFWALQDIAFEVNAGERLGIIGRNGAGKSTLLKLISRITAPSQGRILLKGRVGSLLEVGTGFHPELTGRENIFLNGAILGMSRSEIRRKFDEIVAFAGVDKFLDTPVKRYSSGMYVRLAFAVAAHLESEILLVDEVLAVGDAEFQKKCLGKMQEISKSGGRTVVFVSHNMLAVKTLCTSGILLNNGIIQAQGEISKVIEAYIATKKSSSSAAIEKEAHGFIVHAIKASDNGVDGNFDIEDDLEFIIEVSSIIEQEKINVNLFFNTPDGALIFATCSSGERFKKGKSTYKCVIPAKTLNDNAYSIDLMIVYKGSVILHDIKAVLALQGNEDKRFTSWLGKFPGLIRPQYFSWSKTDTHE